MGLEDDIYHNLRAQDRRSESRGAISDLARRDRTVRDLSREPAFVAKYGG